MKFVENVEHRTFGGADAAQRGRPVMYVTERCVFCLRADCIELAEIAPGVDLEKDILGPITFRPIVDCPTTLTDERIFRDEPMMLRTDILALR